MTTHPDRRAALMMLAAPLALAAVPARAQALPKVAVSKDPSCSCCAGWVAHMRRAGFQVDVTEAQDMEAVKRRLGVPEDLASCHTALVEAYVVEGHVPADAVKRLLAEHPAGKGLAVPGMPVGSPGMEVRGAAADAYAVVLFGGGSPKVFARYRGATPL
ncbi:metal-binding protein [Alsobacter soli]|uniref:Metal-binding protein n=1 Tax=Alsobacter soli TaxID=2109933 RepID=A0A2T1HVH5_9HYPH|nr:DUF411 domain-containing protein [Alsobacter soli]PSC05641.1 metal-binding protein [Alsobacter soli]